MDRDWDIGHSARYAARFLADARLKPQHRREILISLADDCGALRAALPAALWSAVIAARDGSAASNKAFAEAWTIHGRDTVAALKRMARSQKGGKFIKRNVAYLGRLAGLSKVERKLVATLAAYHASETVETICDDARAERITLVKLLGVASGVAADDAVAALGEQGTLVRTGLVSVDTDGAYFSNRFEFRDGLRDALTDRDCDETTLRGKLLGCQRQPGLTVADFEHMAAERDFCTRLLAAAARHREAGINILLYGAPGCGKTEFATLIAKEAGLALHSVGDRHVTCGE